LGVGLDLQGTVLCVVATVLCVVARNHVLCCCLLLQDLVDSGAWKGEDDSGGLVLWDMVSVCMCVCLQVCLSPCVSVGG
jgi:hypothetical protein